VGRRCTVAFGDGGAGTVVTDDAALVLHHGERGRKVRWEPRKGRRGAASGSPSGRTTTTMEESGGVPSLSITVGGQEAGREGQWRREYDTRAWMRGRGKKGGTAAADAFYGGPMAWAGCPGFGAAWREKMDPGFSDVNRHDTDAAAPSCSESGGRRRPHRRSGRGL
jgi:hypothetical protein